MIIAPTYFNRYPPFVKMSRFLNIKQATKREIKRSNEGRNRGGLKKGILACYSTSFPRAPCPRPLNRASFREKVRRRGVKRRGHERKKLRRGERRGEREREKKWRRIRLDYGPYSFNYQRVLWGNETKRFPFNCTLRPVHSTIVLSKNLITGAYGRYPRSATPPAALFYPTLLQLRMKWIRHKALFKTGLGSLSFFPARFFLSLPPPPQNATPTVYNRIASEQHLFHVRTTAATALPALFLSRLTEAV